ncbi:MAG: hypothetical protein ABF370_19990, partial [Verrucomicrobiales bacterium]
MATWSYFFAVNFIIYLTVSPLQGQTKPTPEKPVRIGVVGLVHAHVHGILSRKRDHRKLGREMDLFHMQEEAPGQVFWHP